MQTDYYGYNPNMPSNFYNPGFAQPMAMSQYCQINHRSPSEMMPRLQKKGGKSKTSEIRKYEELTNSTDESIHLVRSRKAAEESARYEEEIKKRSQSGNSMIKGSQRSQPRSHSEVRSELAAPMLQDSKTKGKKKKDKKKKGGLTNILG